MSAKSPVALIFKFVFGLALIGGSLWLAWRLVPQQFKPDFTPTQPALTSPDVAPEPAPAASESPAEPAPVEAPEPAPEPAPAPVVFSGPYQLDEVSLIYLPQNIRLTAAMEFPILVDGIAHGSAVAAAGTEVLRVRVTGPRELVIRYLQNEHSVAADQTDIDARISRMKEYRAQAIQAAAERKAQEAAAASTAAATTTTAPAAAKPSAEPSSEPLESQIDWDAFFGDYD